MTRDPIRTIAALWAACAIGAGAFGAHAAHGASADLLRTGGLYQLVIAVGALVVLPTHRRAATLLLVGSGIFAFSLYAIALGAPRWFGAITPIGGVAMILAWVWVALGRR